MYDPYETEQSQPAVGLFIILALAVTVWFMFMAS